MRKEKMNRKNRRAKKLVVCTLLLALLTTSASIQNAPMVYAEEDYDDEEPELIVCYDQQGIAYSTDDWKSFYVYSGKSVTKSDITITATVDFEGKSYPVTEVELGAFIGNTAIKTVKIENGIEEIFGSFANCSNLQKITIPDSVKSILDITFYNCSKLEKVTLGSKTKSIGMSAFYNCSKLKSIKIPNSVTTIGDGAFYGCGLKSVTIPNSVTQIGKSAFKKNSNLTKVTIGKKLKTIGITAFEQDKKLKSITIKSTKLKNSSVGAKALTKTNSKLVIKVPAKKVTAYKKIFKGKGNKTVTVKKM